MSILDFLYPKKCINCRKFGSYLCSNCFSRISYNDVFVCPMCLRPATNGLTHPRCQKSRGIDGVLPVVIYSSVVKKLIYQFKYKPNLSVLAIPIGRLMTEGLSQNENFYYFVERFKPVLIPIPLSKKRERERGYNHAELIANYVAQYFKLQIRGNVLIRVKDTKPQYKLNKKERMGNIRGAFGIAKASKVPSAVILIDDIATSFATLKEAAKILKQKGAKKVLGVTFAKEA